MYTPAARRPARTRTGTPFRQPWRAKWLPCALVLVCGLAFGWLAGLSIAHWPTVSRLWFEASEAKFLAMSGQSGPATWLVVHDDFQALERAVLPLDDVLGLEVHRLPDEAAIAFTRADSASVARVAALSMVQRVERRRIPMICH